MYLKYRPDIDGLRGIAVLSVIFFHASIPGFLGGFVGVDIFFVISGYLITSLIIKEIDAEGFSVAKFYERRIRRIFPALFFVIAFTVITGAFLFDSIAFKVFGLSVTATTLFTSNILFWRESGYFDAAATTKNLFVNKTNFSERYDRCCHEQQCLISFVQLFKPYQNLSEPIEP